jgi:eukaryotic translation initiation factor 2C
MEPTMTYPFNVKSFFTDRETKDIGSGIQLWRGYFQSVRPGMGKMLINIDISTATMYKGGRLIDICLEFLRKNNPSVLTNIPDREFLKLNKFISGVRVLTKIAADARQPPPRSVKRLTRASARQEEFTLRQGGKSTVAAYFHKVFNRPLQFPDIFCVEVRMT